MLHNLTIGATTSGKTTLNKIMARGLKARGLKIAVLDPLRDGGWPADALSSDPDKFLKFCFDRAKGKEKWAVFIDEAGSMIDREDDRFAFLSTTGRHFGIVSHFIAHRWTTLNPTVRQGCAVRWIFNNDEGKLLAQQYGIKALANCADLPRFHFWRIGPLGDQVRAVLRGRVCIETMRILFDEPQKISA